LIIYCTFFTYIACLLCTLGPVTEETGAMGREIESHHGVG
jgi:hypothetical protein